MPVNLNKPERWKTDIAQSVDMYNNWFIQFAPKAYRETRIEAIKQVEKALEWTSNLTNIEPSLLREHPSILPMLRMTTAPPIARDRLTGLAGVDPNLVTNMEKKKRIPPKMGYTMVNVELQKIGQMIVRLADKEILTWLEDNHVPGEEEIYRAATIVADRLCGANTDPIVRNAQEKRQFREISQWLELRGYVPTRPGINFDEMAPGTYSFRLIVPVTQEDGKGATRPVNIPIDTVVMPLHSNKGDFPLLIEAKSAGDYTNPNKRRKEEVTKFSQLRRQYGFEVRLILFLCGYFNSGYLGYEAAEGIDWIWEHRIDDFAELGI